MDFKFQPTYILFFLLTPKAGTHRSARAHTSQSALMRRDRSPGEGGSWRPRTTWLPWASRQRQTALWEGSACMWLSSRLMASVGHRGIPAQMFTSCSTLGHKVWFLSSNAEKIRCFGSFKWQIIHSSARIRSHDTGLVKRDLRIILKSIWTRHF